MPTKTLPPSPDLVHLKYQAKDLMKGHGSKDLQAGQRIREFHPRFEKASDLLIFESKLTLSDAQLTIAREYGFGSWMRLKKHIENTGTSDNLSLPLHERIEDAAFRRALDLLDAGDAEGLSAFLTANPDVAHRRVTFEGGNYFTNPSLLEFVAENPVRRGRLPFNIAIVAKVILDAGAKDDPSAIDGTLGLVCSGSVSRECGVQGQLIELLCDHGADPNSAMLPALVHGEFEAVNALIRRNARISLLVEAATGRLDHARELLPSASAGDRQCALALAAQFGHAEIVGLLLDAGEDPSRYNPVGTHSHSTPLHQAALAGHEKAVRLLVERGARLDLKDTLFQGVPADWARYAGRSEVEQYLRSTEANRKANRGLHG